MMKNHNDHSGSELNVLCLQGDEAIQLLDKLENQKHWISLMNETKESSIFQSPGFVLPWYKQHRNEFSPLVLLATQNDQWIGLFTLARKIHMNGGHLLSKLVGAGNFYALYQTWLVLPAYETIFWEKGIKLLFEKIPGCSINLKSLPSLKSYQKLKSEKNFKKMTVLEKFSNPVLNFKLEGHDKVLSKRHFKSKYNRLQRAGKVEFEKIENRAGFDLVFDEIEVFMNLRQGAVFNKIPFPRESNDRNLFLEWFEKGVLYVSSLRLDGNLIGAIVMMEDKGETVHLAGLITYSPLHAKLSPGLIHLYLLAQKLKEDDFHNLKLSPGYDVYKERYSNSSEHIYELLITKNSYQIFRRKIRIKFRNFVLGRGIRPMELGVWFSKTKASWKNKWNNWKFKRKFNALEINELLHFLSKVQNNQSNEGDTIYFGNQILNPLLLIDDVSLECSRWEFLEDALKRLEENQGFVALVQNNRLTACIWTVKVIEDIKCLGKNSDDGEVKKVYISRYFEMN